MTSLCVFCGSSAGTADEYRIAARSFGAVLAERGLGLVYGGSDIGLMGLVSAAVRDNGGRVTGVIPRLIAGHVPEQKGIETEVVDGMHERKARMYELADAFAALPGGIGTMEETFEAWTWNQLGYHSKPLGLLNIGGYFDQLLGFLDRMSTDGFLRTAWRSSLLVDTDPHRLLDRMEGWSAPSESKWSTRIS